MECRFDDLKDEIIEEAIVARKEDYFVFISQHDALRCSRARTACSGRQARSDIYMKDD